MKYIRHINENRNLMDKCIYLFEQLWREKLKLSKVNIVNSYDYSNYRLFTKSLSTINRETYKHYRELFDLLEKLKLEFTLDAKTYTGVLSLNVDIVDIEEFIDEMELLKNIKKYNL